ncbi:MAG: hypothetical protein M0Q13_00185 [Methanothrix sp.]|jgi:hypothetical protein|nr:hypothetical protein [Methanothrix sp.]
MIRTLDKMLSIALLFTLSIIPLTDCVFAAELGTRENPLPIGTTMDLGDGWQIKILKVYPDATQKIRNENPFNGKPDEGNQYFMATIEARYSGEKEESFPGRYRLHVVGASSLVSEPPLWGVVPNDLPINQDVFPGGVISGNVYWEIKSSDADSLVLYDDKAEDRIFYSLSP